MKTTKNFVTFFILSFPFIKFNELYSQGWNACMDAPENCGSGGSGKSIGEQVEWWQSILIIIVVSLVIFQIFKKLDSTPIKVTVVIIGGLIIFSAIPPEVLPWILPIWGVIAFIIYKIGSPDVERIDSKNSQPYKEQTKKTRVITKETHSDSVIRKKSNTKNEEKRKDSSKVGLVKPSKSEYKGKMKDGKPHGKGTITFSSGAKYVGELNNGVICGLGTYTWPDGDMYVGDWKDGKQHGHGTFTAYGQSGRKYVGEYKDGLRNGQGKILSYRDVIVYEGEFKDGKKNGNGKTFWSCEDPHQPGIRHIYFEGEWKDDKVWNGQYYNKFGSISEQKAVNGKNVWPQT